MGAGRRADRVAVRRMPESGGGLSALRLLPVPNAEGDAAMARADELARAVLAGAARASEAKELAQIILDALPIPMTKCSRVSCLYTTPVGLGSVCAVCRVVEARR